MGTARTTRADLEPTGRHVAVSTVTHRHCFRGAIYQATSTQFCLVNIRSTWSHLSCSCPSLSIYLITTRYLDLEKTLLVEMNVFCDACRNTTAGCCVFFVENNRVRLIESQVKIALSTHARTAP